MSHAAVPLAVGLGLGREVISRRLLVCGMLASMAPDLDVYAPQALHWIDHRGITHSIGFALGLSAGAAVAAGALHTRPLVAFLFILLSTFSHGLLDAFTTGGQPIALLWPFSDARFFMPVQVIEASPIGISSFFSKRGLLVLASEFVWIWSAAVLLGIALYLFRRSD